MCFTVSAKGGLNGCFVFAQRAPDGSDFSALSFVAWHTAGRGIVYVIRNGLQWKAAPKDYGSHKVLSNRFIRWSWLGVFDRIFAALGRRH
jgi:transposase